MKHIFSAIALLLSFAGLNGCSSGEHTVNLATPTEVVSENVNGPKVCIADVSDNRLFIGSESQPNLPSGEILSNDYKARAYARLKNTLGQQSGSLLLPEDSSVAALVKKTIAQAFADSGFQLVENAAAEDTDILIIAIDIKQFWTWSPLDKINADIYSDIELDVYSQDANGQKKLNLKNRQTQKVLTDTKTLYRKATEASIANIYHLACQKIKTIFKN